MDAVVQTIIFKVINTTNKNLIKTKIKGQLQKLYRDSLNTSEIKAKGSQRLKKIFLLTPSLQGGYK